MKCKAAGMALVLGLALGPVVQAMPAPPIPPFVSAAVADPGRPEADRKRDADRHPAELVAFSRIKPGDKVADFWPGGGYFSHVFARVVGPKGRVYAITPQEYAAIKAAKGQAVATAPDPAYPNIVPLVRPVASFSAPEKLDMVWTSQNYHDLHDTFMGPADLGVFNKAVYDALKPGGVYVVVDHAAPGTGLSATDTLHRIDPLVVRQEVEKAGFVFDGESAVLRNPADPHTANVFKPEIRGHTDQFVYRFRKPRV